MIFKVPHFFSKNIDADCMIRDPNGNVTFISDLCDCKRSSSFKPYEPFVQSKSENDTLDFEFVCVYKDQEVTEVTGNWYWKVRTIIALFFIFVTPNRETCRGTLFRLLSCSPSS